MNCRVCKSFAQSHSTTCLQHLQNVVSHKEERWDACPYRVYYDVYLALIAVKRILSVQIWSISSLSLRAAVLLKIHYLLPCGFQAFSFDDSRSEPRLWWFSSRSYFTSCNLCQLSCFIVLAAKKNQQYADHIAAALSIPRQYQIGIVSHLANYYLGTEAWWCSLHA